MTIQIKDLTGCKTIDMSAVRGGIGSGGLSGGTVVLAFSQFVASEFSPANIGSLHIDPVLAPASRIEIA
jgi:hypothetical protein